MARCATDVALITLTGDLALDCLARPAKKAKTTNDITSTIASTMASPGLKTEPPDRITFWLHKYGLSSASPHLLRSFPQLVAAAFLSQQSIRGDASFPTVTAMLEHACTVDNPLDQLDALAREPHMHPPVAKPVQLWVPDHTRIDDACAMAFRTYLEKTHLAEFVRDYTDAFALAVYNKFINLDHCVLVQRCWSKADAHHALLVDAEKDRLAVKKERIIALRRGDHVPPTPHRNDISVVDAVDAEPVKPVTYVKPAVPQPEHSRSERSERSLVQLVHFQIVGDEGREREFPDALAEQANRMQDMSTLEVEQFEQQLLQWQAGEKAADELHECERF